MSESRTAIQPDIASIGDPQNTASRLQMPSADILRRHPMYDAEVVDPSKIFLRSFSADFSSVF